MALIQKIERVTKQRHSVHKSVRCRYSIFVEDNKKYLQLDTFGSANREFPDIASQEMQFDEAAAAELMNIIRKEFPSLA